MAGVWKHSAATTPAEMLVLLALADWADEYGYCYPSQLAIAGKARVSERQVQRVIQKFTGLGELEKQLGGHAVSAPGHRPGRTGLQHRNLYRLTCVPDEASGDTVATLRHGGRDDEPPPLGPSGGPPGAPRRDDRDDGKGTTGATAKGRQERRERDDRSDAPIRKIRQEDPSDDHPSGDPSENVQAGAPPRQTSYREEPTGDSPDDNLGIITKLAHFALEQLGPDSPDLTEAVKELCGKYHIKPYDCGVVRKAIESAIWQRGHRSAEG
jgi:hypothetical protein